VAYLKALVKLGGADHNRAGTDVSANTNLARRAGDKLQSLSVKEFDIIQNQSVEVQDGSIPNATEVKLSDAFSDLPTRVHYSLPSQCLSLVEASRGKRG
jgi:hypothetical protein